jgi:hypothetical protein
MLTLSKLLGGFQVFVAVTGFERELQANKKGTVLKTAPC